MTKISSKPKGFLLALLLLYVLAIPIALGQGEESPFGSASQNANSLRGEIYYLAEGTSSLPDFSTITPVGSIYTQVLDVPQRSFNSGFPGVTDRFEWFAIRYTGSFIVNTEGDYIFRLVSDDGSRLFIDGQMIIDNDGVHPPQSVSGNAYLSRGQHQIEVDYFQGPRELVALQLFWTPPGGSEEISSPQYVPEPTEEQPGETEEQPGNDESECIAGLDLTGVWSCDDGGSYYIRQVGDTVWWLGEISPTDPAWSNVANGDILGCTIYLEYADIPKGSAIGAGSLVLEIVSSNEIKAVEKPESYGGSRWWREGDIYVSPPVSPPIDSSSTTNPWEDQTVRQLIDEWLLQQDRCVKEVYPGAYIDRWGRICGSTDSATISCTQTPDKPADWDNYHYLWYNNWCPEYYYYRVQDYVELRQSGETFDSLAECKARGESCY